MEEERGNVGGREGEGGRVGEGGRESVCGVGVRREHRR